MNALPKAAPAFDVARVRADFPVLSRQVYGKPLVYLDNGASAQKPVQVLDRMDHAFRHEYANVHRGLHTLANRATEAYEGGRHAAQKFLNAARPEEIVFTKSATEAINLVAQSFAGRAGHLIEPVIKPLGYDWKIGIGLIGSFAAREVFVNTMSVVYAVEENDEDTSPLRERIRKLEAIAAGVDL